jgi:hypothetical protein
MNGSGDDASVFQKDETVQKRGVDGAIVRLVGRWRK